MTWIEAIARLSRQDKSCVIVTVLAVRGSAPRDAMSKMVVDENAIYDTIGGGNLEYQAIAKARDMLSSSSNNEPTIVRESFTLGKDLTQCCGGKVELLFEHIAAQDFNVVVFGAGHVGKALVTILSELPCKVRWIDARDEFIQVHKNAALGSNIDIMKMQNPDVDVERGPANAYFLVMTHSHELDMQLVEAILSRNDARFCGLIGSKSKAAKFRSRLARKQFSSDEIARLTSPIGLARVGGKRPMEVAVSVAGQLIALRQQHMQNKSDSASPTNADGKVIDVMKV
ncbi:xanthine dehydrogenase accessory protein XdhC [Candidatus Spongiihabitans sp.]|uniref:xanthine dehydrogenase accessory protein XdhC n=1 Tax=Candidatus Spongiihabitans sp. TaxID=3101308 RepID=UPI003C7B61B9